MQSSLAFYFERSILLRNTLQNKETCESTYEAHADVLRATSSLRVFQDVHRRPSRAGQKRAPLGVLDSLEQSSQLGLQVLHRVLHVLQETADELGQ